MNDQVRKTLEYNITPLHGIDFQHFFQKLMSIIYRGRQFSLADTSDLGADCLVMENNGNVEKIYAVYAPKSIEYKLPVFKKKFQSDYDQFIAHWSQDQIEWIPVINRKYTGKALQFLQQLASPNILYDLDKIFEVLESFKYLDLKDVFEYLAIDENYLIYNILDIIIEDIQKLDFDEQSKGIKNRVPNLMDKIRKNFKPNLVDSKQKYFEEICYQEISKFHEYYEGLDSETQSMIKEKFHSSNELFISVLELDERIRKIIEYIGKDHLQDDYYIYWLKIIIHYMFEICIIGEGP